MPKVSIMFGQTTGANPGCLLWPATQVVFKTYYDLYKKKITRNVIYYLSKRLIVLLDYVTWHNQATTLVGPKHSILSVSLVVLMPMRAWIGNIRLHHYIQITLLTHLCISLDVFWFIMADTNYVCVLKKYVTWLRKSRSL